MGPYRVLVSDLVCVTMSEPPLAGEEEVAAVRSAVHELRPEATVVAVALRPHPAEPVAGERVALFTTASGPIQPRLGRYLADEHGADVTAVVGSLGDRRALRADLEAPGVLAAHTYLVEITAAAIDVVAEAAQERGARVVFCDNRPVPLPGEPDLDAAVTDLAEEVTALHA
jgi:cyclic 2,3-diphosphoglycerate synthetase